MRRLISHAQKRMCVRSDTLAAWIRTPAHVLSKGKRWVALPIAVAVYGCAGLPTQEEFHARDVAYCEKWATLSTGQRAAYLSRGLLLGGVVAELYLRDAQGEQPRSEADYQQCMDSRKPRKQGWES